jgi:hypothetical protein
VQRKYFTRLQDQTGVFLLGLARRGVDIGNVLAAGAGKCKPLDREAADAYEARGGRFGARNLAMLEADWIATNLGLLYVAPRVDYIWTGRWSDLYVEAGRVHRVKPYADIYVAEEERVLTFVVGKAAAKDILEIAAHFNATQQ